MNEQTTGIKVYEDTEMRQAWGCKVAPGYKEAWDFDKQRKMVQDSKGVLHYTLPLNGWRARELAKTVIGERDSALWYDPGKVVVVPTKHLQALPNFDQFYVDYLNDLAEREPVVIIQVVVVEPSYGVHIIVLPAQ